jgi:sialidase-1
LLFSGSAGPGRENGTLYASHDNGKTWLEKRILFPGAFGYSGLTQLSDGQIGCLFETDNSNRIVFARFPLVWLEANAEAFPSGAK